MTNLAVTKTLKPKGNIPDNKFHNNWRHFDVLPHFFFSTSEMMCDYYLQTWNIRVSSRVAKGLQTKGFRKLWKIRKVSQPNRMIA